MSKSRRLLIDLNRIRLDTSKERRLVLTFSEAHYLNRVVRLNVGDLIEVVDGQGSLWNAQLIREDTIEFTTSIDLPKLQCNVSKPKLALAVVIPKKGFEDIIRMTCEIGIDIIQPLYSERSSCRVDWERKSSRWNSIIRESVEQSERLWSPALEKTLELKEWFTSLNLSKATLLIATTRRSSARSLINLLEELNGQKEDIWLIVGPEGGWTDEEIKISTDLGFKEVSYSEHILRTSTAAVTGTSLIVSWSRRR